MHLLWVGYVRMHPPLLLLLMSRGMERSVIRILSLRTLVGHATETLMSLPRRILRWHIVRLTPRHTSRSLPMHIVGSRIHLLLVHTRRSLRLMTRWHGRTR